MKHDETFRVTDNHRLADDIYRLSMERKSGDADLPEPGQFAMIQVRDGVSPLLRRPLSYLKADDKNIEFIYRVTGVGTRILMNALPGDYLNVLGPLGRGFDPALAKNNAVLVAGGIGMPPLCFLSGVLKAGDVENIEILYGAAAGDELVMRESLESVATSVVYATDDGSEGHNGLVTELLEERLKKNRPDVIYSCGPNPMLREVARIAARESVPCQVSVEARMACGIGACLGCAVPTADGGYLQVCEDGPVFNAVKLFPGGNLG